MKSIKYLIDSNILIRYASNASDKSILLKLDTIFDSSFNYSSIVYMEVMGFQNESMDAERLQMLFDTGVGFDIDTAVINQTIEIRKAHKIKLPDAIIAATAIVNEFNLLTDNTNNFSRIKGLEITNSHGISL